MDTTWNRKTHYHGAGYGSFYSDEYQAIAKGMRKILKQCVTIPKAIHPALARRMQQAAENAVNTQDTGRTIPASQESQPVDIENITDMSEVEEAMMETQREAALWQEQERTTYCVGALEDDGDLDYEAQE